MLRDIRSRVTLPLPGLTPPAHHAVTLRPSQLAELLDEWALRREKVILLIDLAAAHAARDLARRCRVLAVIDEDDPLADGEGGPLALEWLEIRERVATLLQKSVVHKAPPPD